MDKVTPERLYKYRKFCARALDMVVNDKLYYASAASFNDPLDSRPSVRPDLGNGQLEEVLRELVKRRVVLEQEAAVLIRGDGIVRFRVEIEEESRRQAEFVIHEVYDSAMESGGDAEAARGSVLRRRITDELRRQYNKGIVSFAERADCPLMWSHYGDEHRGFCLGYSVPAGAADNVYKVVYGDNREVMASDVAAMLKGDDAARRQVDETALLRKAPDWSYEQEWRLIGPRGLYNSGLELEEIIFGMRCEESAKYVVMKVLEQRPRPVRFYEMRESDTFNLKKCLLDKTEFFSHFPRRSLSIFEAFEC